MFKLLSVKPVKTEKKRPRQSGVWGLVQFNPNDPANRNNFDYDRSYGEDDGNGPRKSPKLSIRVALEILTI